jgi:hypothetical protein
LNIPQSRSKQRDAAPDGAGTLIVCRMVSNPRHEDHQRLARFTDGLERCARWRVGIADSDRHPALGISGAITAATVEYAGLLRPLPAPNFGVISAAGPARTVQLGLRFVF